MAPSSPLDGRTTSGRSRFVVLCCLASLTFSALLAAFILSPRLASRDHDSLLPFFTSIDTKHSGGAHCTSPGEGSSSSSLASSPLSATSPLHCPTCPDCSLTNSISSSSSSSSLSEADLAAVCNQRASSTSATANKSVVASAAASFALPANLYRLSRVFDRLDAGLPIVVGVVGGSNSAGHGLKDHDNLVWRQLVNWLNERWPTTSATANQTHTLRNGAKPASTSALAAWCLDELLGSPVSSVDLLFVDYAVNDDQPNENFALRSALDAPIDVHSLVRGNMERLTRRVLRSAPNTALLFLYMARTNVKEYWNIEKEHELVAQHYSVPSTSFRHFMQQTYTAATSKWSVLMPFVNYTEPRGWAPLMDGNAHATDLGHAVCVELIKTRIMELYDAYHANGKKSMLPPKLLTTQQRLDMAALQQRVAEQQLPAAMESDANNQAIDQHCRMFPTRQLSDMEVLDTLDVVENEGWQYNTTGSSKDKWAMVSRTECGESGVDCHLSVRLPLPTGSSGSGSGSVSASAAGAADEYAAPDSVQLLYLRSWRPSMGSAWAWLQCSRDPLRVSRPVVLDGHWESRSSQTGMESVWPPSRAQQSVQGTDTADIPPPLRTDNAVLESGEQANHRLPCPFDRLLIWQRTPGEFAVSGYIYGYQ